MIDKYIKRKGIYTLRVRQSKSTGTYKSTCTVAEAVSAGRFALLEVLLPFPPGVNTVSPPPNPLVCCFLPAIVMVTIYYDLLTVCAQKMKK